MDFCIENLYSIKYSITYAWIMLCVRPHTHADIHPTPALLPMDTHQHKHTLILPHLHTRLFTPPCDTPCLYTHTYFLCTALHIHSQAQKHRPLHTYALHSSHTGTYTKSCAHVHNCTQTPSHTCTNPRILSHICIYTHMYLYIPVHTHVPAHRWTCTSMCPCTHAYLHTHICKYLLIYTPMHIPSNTQTHPTCTPTSIQNHPAKTRVHPTIRVCACARAHTYTNIYQFCRPGFRLKHSLYISCGIEESILCYNYVCIIPLPLMFDAPFYLLPGSQ